MPHPEKRIPRPRSRPLGEDEQAVLQQCDVNLPHGFRRGPQLREKGRGHLDPGHLLRRNPDGSLFQQVEQLASGFGGRPIPIGEEGPPEIRGEGDGTFPCVASNSASVSSIAAVIRMRPTR